MATEMQTRRPRTDSAQRWQAALQRAIENGIEVFRIAGTGEYVVTSATKLDTVYRSDGISCECDAARSGDSICQHRAVVRYVTGWIEELPLPTIVPVACRGCNGCGRIPNDFHQRYDVCPVCGGTGIAPTPATPRPTGLPAVTIVAAAA